MTPKILIVLLTLSSTAYAGPFVNNPSPPKVQQQPQAVNPDIKGLCYGTQAQCLGGLPLASPTITSSGIISAFEDTHMSQENPNSPMPAVSKTCAKWTWSGKDNTGWQCTAKPIPKPVQQAIPAAVCQQYMTSIRCTVKGQRGSVGGVNGQGACLFSNNIAITNNGQEFSCTSYN
jgi:hypothetical protein